MVVETMWPDVAYKCISGIYFESDEGRKDAQKTKLAEVIIIGLEYHKLNF